MPRTNEQLISGAAIAFYSTICLAVMWKYAHEYARSADVAEPTGFGGAGSLAFAYVLPLVVGFGVGRYWAPALILVLLVCGGISADILEPLQRPELPEGETGAALSAMIIALFHAPLLVLGAWLRKRLWPRTPAKKWSLT